MISHEKPEDFSAQFEVVGCFCEYNGQILLLHRHDDKSQGNTWGVPAGKREPKESLSNAMLREIKEEIGVKIPKNQLEYNEKIFVRYSEYDFVYHIFHTTFEIQPEIVINKKEHKAFRWITPKNALKMNLIEDLESCIKLFYKVR